MEFTSHRKLAGLALAGFATLMLTSAADAAGRGTQARMSAIVTSEFCTDGRTADGACVNPATAQAARLIACATTQARLSASGGPACAPVGIDRNYRYPGAVFADAYRTPALPTMRYYTTTY